MCIFFRFLTALPTNSAQIIRYLFDKKLYGKFEDSTSNLAFDSKQEEYRSVCEEN